MKERLGISNQADVDYPISRNGFIGVAAGLSTSAGVLIAHANEVRLPDENMDTVLKAAAGMAGLAVAVLIAGYEWSNRAERQGAFISVKQIPNESPLADFTEERPASS